MRASLEGIAKIFSPEEVCGKAHGEANIFESRKTSIRKGWLHEWLFGGVSTRTNSLLARIVVMGKNPERSRPERSERGIDGPASHPPRNAAAVAGIFTLLSLELGYMVCLNRYTLPVESIIDEDSS